MRSLRARVVLVMLGALVVTVIAGCAASPVPALTPSATPDAAAPLFASDDEALAAAEEAYAAYRDASDRIFADGGSEPERLAEYASSELFERERAGFDQAMAEGLRYVGATNVVAFRLQAHRPKARPPEPLVTAYACVDYSDVDVLDASGTSRTDPSRSKQLGFLVSFVPGIEQPRAKLVVSDTQLWASGGVC